MPEDQQGLRWLDIWTKLPKEEKAQALERFAHTLRNGPPEQVREEIAPAFLKKLAEAVHFRPQTLVAMSDARLARVLRRGIPGVMDDVVWKILFSAYYFADKQSLMCRFLDLCGIEHDERGGVEVEVIPPSDIAGITAQLVEEQGASEVWRYYAVLLLHHRKSWHFLEQILPSIEGEAGQQLPSERQETLATHTEEESTIDRELTNSFTQLDRVLIEQVIASAAGEERALSSDEVFDLVQTVRALDTGRTRTYFHLGFLNALMGDEPEGPEGPEMNDVRRQWYLAGLLAGFARQRKLDLVDRFLERCRGDFERAASRPGEAGASMAKTVFPLLLESGRLQHALMLLKGQFSAAGETMGHLALLQASEMLRRGEVAEAKAVLGTLHDVLRRFGDVPHGIVGPAFRQAVRRKLGQAYQAGGELERARSLFEKLLADDGDASAKLLSDMGLLEAGFSGLQEVRVEGDLERRQALMAALENGRGRFEEAISRFGDEAHHAHYALAVHDYLRFMDGEPEAREHPDLAKSAMRHAEAALSGMIASDESEAFDRLGITGQCRFILGVLKMSLLDPSHAPLAMRTWQGIPTHAGRFPKDHLERFLEWSELADTHSAIQIAESIWEVRGAEALELLRHQEWVVRSDTLREAFLAAAYDADRSRAERYGLWAFLVPALLRGRYPEQATDGLDAMEVLAEEDGDLAERFAGWLQEKAHYDPAWSESDRLRACYRCHSRVGQQVEAVAALRNLFHAVKHENALEAAGIRALVVEYEGHEDAAADLIVLDDGQELSTEDAASVEERLKQGDQVKVLFIGGNEIQARYDQKIRSVIQCDWPGAEVQFEHTGWSSNWGREVEKLKKLARESDAVVLMSMMRTKLGRTMRAALNDPPRPWVPCTGTGRKVMEQSIRKAMQVGLLERIGRKQIAGC